MDSGPFPILNQKIFGKRLVYLDNAATTQKPQVVIDAIKQFYETSNANIHRGIHHLAEKSTMAYESSRETVARFIGAETDEIVFTSGTTHSLNMLVQMLGKNLHPGDEIVLTMMEHHSNLIPWQEMAREKELIVKFIPLTADYTLDLQKARELITAKTKVLAFTHVSNTLGTINPAAELIALAHAQGALAVVDVAQSVGHLPLNVRQLDCDFLAFSGHKMCGPLGIGVLYGKKDLLINLEPAFFGGGMVEDVSSEVGKALWLAPPQRFEAGTPPIAGAIGLARAVDFLEKQGLKQIEAHCTLLREYAIKELKKIPRLNIIGPEQGGIGIISFTLEVIHPHDVAEILNREGIAVRAGHHCTIPLMKELGLADGTTRASFYLYNTIEDVDALVAGIRKVQEVFR
ncbi:SufS family cysteine desulfurase [Candidatus Woesearchaeota archaeon]|nr:SufS family cysteine desulfurase [Candidatus Woesearchaeota archaeon]